MTTSESINELAAALAEAQSEFDQIHRTREVTVRPKDTGKAAYKFSYSPLDEVLRATRPALRKHGLAISHPCSTKETSLVCGTRLIHKSGQWIEDVLEFPRPAGLQEIGSALTYMRRYTLTGILGVVADEDDDGNGADGNEFEATERKPNPACPQCGNNTNVIPGRPEYGGGWLCWNKPDKNKHGCGHKWQDGETQPPTKDEKKPAAKPKATKPLTTAKDPNDATSPYSKAMAKILNHHCAPEEFATFRNSVLKWMDDSPDDTTADQKKALEKALSAREDELTALPV